MHMLMILLRVNSATVRSMFVQIPLEIQLDALVTLDDLSQPLLQSVIAVCLRRMGHDWLVML